MLTALTMLLAAGQAQAGEVVVSKESDPIVCEKKTDHMVGTRIKAKRVCMRKSEWDDIERNTQRALRAVNDRRLHPGAANGRD